MVIKRSSSVSMGEEVMQPTANLFLPLVSSGHCTNDTIQYR